MTTTSLPHFLSRLVHKFFLWFVIDIVRNILVLFLYFFNNKVISLFSYFNRLLGQNSLWQGLVDIISERTHTVHDSFLLHFF